MRGGRRPGLAGVGLLAVLAAAVIPPALDTDTPSEKRKAAATAIDDPAQRDAAETRAGAIDGCVDGTKRRLEGTPEAGKLDVDAYCTCFIQAIVRGPEDDTAQLQAMAIAIKAGNPPPELTRAAARCARQSRTA